MILGILFSCVSPTTLETVIFGLPKQIREVGVQTKVPLGAGNVQPICRLQLN